MENRLMEDIKKEAYRILLRRMKPIRGFLKVSQIVLESYKISYSESENNLNTLFEEAADNLIKDESQPCRTQNATTKHHDRNEYKVVQYTDALNIISIISIADIFLSEIKMFLFKHLEIKEAINSGGTIYRNNQILKDLGLSLDEESFSLIWDRFMEIRERRNVYVHRDFIADKKYVEKAQRVGIEVQENQYLTIDYLYFNTAIGNTIEMMEVVTDHCISKLEEKH